MNSEYEELDKLWCQRVLGMSEKALKELAEHTLNHYYKNSIKNGIK